MTFLSHDHLCRQRISVGQKRCLRDVIQRRTTTTKMLLCHTTLSCITAVIVIIIVIIAAATINVVSNYRSPSDLTSVCNIVQAHGELCHDHMTPAVSTHGRMMKRKSHNMLQQYFALKTAYGCCCLWLAKLTFIHK